MQMERYILEAALEGLQAQRERIEGQMEDVARSMGGGAGKARKAKQAKTPGPAKRKISAAGRKRIAEAQKKRHMERRKAEKKSGEEKQ